MPFIRFCKTFNIPWYILSDGEPDAIKAVKSALSKIDIKLEAKPDNVFIISDGKDFEQYLIDLGYQTEIRDGIIQMENSIFEKLIFSSPQEENARKKILEKRIVEIKAYNDVAILDYMDKNKTSISPIVTELIIKLGNKIKRFPPLLKNLLDKVSADLKFKIDKSNL